LQPGEEARHIDLRREAEGGDGKEEEDIQEGAGIDNKRTSPSLLFLHPSLLLSSSSTFTVLHFNQLPFHSLYFHSPFLLCSALLRRREHHHKISTCLPRSSFTCLAHPPQVGLTADRNDDYNDDALDGMF
jgi:hypothetical protein